MEYIISFLEGIITFISPCLLPMLPIYLVYFTAGHNDRSRSKNTVVNALGFILGFTIVFVSLGAFAASLGGLLKQHQTAVNLITGFIVILFGLNFMGAIKIGFLNNTVKAESTVKPLGFFSAMLFGVVFSIGWTPCVGAFLGSALMLASQQGSVLKGITMLLAYSAGLGVPFLLSAFLIDKLKSTFDFIKRNYKIINIVCGILLVIVGILMMTGKIGVLLSSLSV
ncbi:MAG: cytochrome c biogenesis protein CcdA [Oscillospiraceae bacterium]